MMRTRGLFAAATMIAVCVCLTTLTGCVSATEQAECNPLFANGAASDSVQISGGSAATLELNVTAPHGVVNTQRTVLSRATSPGAVVTDGSIVAANFAYADATSGELLEVSERFGSAEASSMVRVHSDEDNPILLGLLCAAAGDTVAMVLSAEESANYFGMENPVVLVAEVQQVYEDRASGRAHALPSGFPAVTTDHTGRPGVVLPPGLPPTELRAAARIVGEGQQITAAHTVIAQVLTVSWDGTQRTNTWNSTPMNFGTGENPASSLRPVLNGHTVGSQVVIVEPGEQLPSVSVVDILAVM